MAHGQPRHFIDPTHLTYGKVVSEKWLHMTGGLRACEMENGWFISPFPDANGRPGRTLGPVPEENIRDVCSKLRVTVLGADQISQSDPILPTRIWTPVLGPHRLASNQQPADTWAGIATAAAEAEDDDYELLARAVSASLRSAGIRIRDGSDCY